MRRENLVLFRPRSQRIAEMIVLPSAALAVGPEMRDLLGDGYTSSYGLLAAMLLVFIMAVVARLWASRHGGEWVTSSERQRRLIAEAAATAPWQDVVPAAAMAALSLLAFALIVGPLADLGGSIGGPLNFLATFILIAGVGYRALLVRRALIESEVVDDEPREDDFFSAVRRDLPWSYLACAIGAATGLVISLQLDGVLRFVLFTVAFIVVTGAIHKIRFRDRIPQLIYPWIADSNLATQLLLGSVIWSGPIGFAVFGIVFLGPWETSFRVQLGLQLGFFTGLLGGCVAGAVIYSVRRRSVSRQRGPWNR